ncbi:MAG: hypothetical protein SGPRY_002781, partial [Prymnesium sp.]
MRGRLELSGPATSLSVAPQEGLAVVAGREVLRLISYSDDGLADKLDLLAHSRKTPHLSSNDVKWRPQHASQVVTGATSGAVLIWDTAKRGDCLVRTLGFHQRTVNALAFLEREPNKLLSASMDKTVRLWDVGQRLAQQQQVFSMPSEVRDVQFSKVSSTRFAVALENGMIQAPSPQRLHAGAS